jgi:hypothetical protein
VFLSVLTRDRSLARSLVQVMASRTYGGVHWRESGFAGRSMARRVTEYHLRVAIVTIGTLGWLRFT